jgi:hypothetical protein
MIAMFDATRTSPLYGHPPPGRMTGATGYPEGTLMTISTGSHDQSVTLDLTSQTSLYPFYEYTFDIRRPRQAHIAFAGGIHMCLGMHSARLKTRVMLNSLFDRVIDLALAPDDGTGDATRIVGLTFRSPNKLPVTFTPMS